MAVFGVVQISTKISVSAAEIKLDLKLSSEIERTESYNRVRSCLIVSPAWPGLAGALSPGLVAVRVGRGRRGGRSLGRSLLGDFLQHLAEEHVEEALELLVSPRRRAG